MKQNKAKADNYLDYIPGYNEQYKWEKNEMGEITIFVENKGFFNWIAQKFFKKPRVSQVHLEEMGNFIWPLIDGKRSVYGIGECLKEEFGEKAEPLYPRLVQYMRNLENYGFIQMHKEENVREI
ncbi:MAG: PqqD family protein [Lachnospiraceae bacterium]